jgi:tetratricopeptide (TPR) repeat protein
MEPSGTEQAAAAMLDQDPVSVSPAKTMLWAPLGLRYHLAIILTMGTIILLTYANSFTTGFALDNKFIILEDPRLRDANRTNINLIFSQDYWWPKAVSGLYRPLTTASYLVNYAMLGNKDHAAGYHWINFFLHWANAVLVYFMVLVLMEKLWPAFFAAALFATHPVATESVTNIIGRADLFATLFVVGGFLLYAKSTTVEGWRKVPWLLALMVSTTVSVFCKESAVVVLGVMALYDFTYRMQRKHPNWLANFVANFWGFTVKGYIALVPSFAALWYVRSQVFEKLRPPELPWVDNPLAIPGTDFWTQRITAIKVIGRYFWLLVWPQTLSCDYSYNEIPLVNWQFLHWEDWKAIIALVALIVVILVAVRNYHRNKAVFFFVMFFFGTFLPTSNLMRIIGSIMAERFMYMPSIGFAGCVMITAYAICRRFIPRLDVSAWAQKIWLQVVARSALSLIVIAYGARAFVRNFDWQDDERLWSQAVLVCPASFKTHKSLAFALYEKDPSPENKELDRIIEEGEKALAVTDKTQIVLLHLGAYYRMKGDALAQRAPDGSRIPTALSMPWYQKSADVLVRAVPLDREFNEDNRQKELRRGRKPEQIQDIGNHEIYWNLGLSYMRLAQYQNALDAYLYMRHLAPTNPDSYLSMASVYLSSGHSEESVTTLLQALLLDSGRVEALRLLVDVYRQIDKEGCAVVFAQGQPRLNADCALVRNNICAAYLGLTQVFLETKQYPLAVQTKQNALQNYHCPPEPFNQLIPDRPITTSSKK